MRERSGLQHDAAVLLHAHPAAFEPCAARWLHERAYANSVYASGCSNLVTAAQQVGIAADIKRVVQRARVITRVILVANWRYIWKCIWRDEVQPPDLERVHSKRFRRRVHDSLGDQGGLRPTGTPIGARWRAVGEESNCRAPSNLDV